MLKLYNCICSLPIVRRTTILGAERCNFAGHLLCTGVFARWKSSFNPPGRQIVSICSTNIFMCTHNQIYVLNFPWISLNILLAQGGVHAKLGDFGFALDMPKHDSCRTLVTAPIIAQTNGYSPPEVQSGKFSPKSDMFSYGIVSWLENVM